MASISDNTSTFYDFIIPRGQTTPTLTFDRLQEYVKLMKRRGWFNFEEVDGIIKCIFDLQAHEYMGSFMDNIKDDNAMITILNDFATIDGIDIKPLTKLIIICRLRRIAAKQVDSNYSSPLLMQKLIIYENHCEFSITTPIKMAISEQNRPKHVGVFFDSHRKNMSLLCHDDDHSILDEIDKYYLFQCKTRVIVADKIADDDKFASGGK